MVEQKFESQSKWPLYLSGAILLALILSYFTIPAVGNFVDKAYDVLTSDDKQRISAWVDEFGLWGPFIIIATMVVQMFLLVIPSPLLMIVSILAYGPLWGTLLAISAVAIASSLGYMIGNYFGEMTVIRLIGEKQEKKLTYYVEKYGFWAVVIFRLAPVLSNDAISFVGGMIQLSYRKFIGATLLGITPLALIFAYFGENPDRLKHGLIWISAVSVVFLALYIYFDQRKNPLKRDS